MTTISAVATIQQQRNRLRKEMRKKRLQLTPEQQQQAEQTICAQALQWIEQQQAQTVALYLSSNGEVSTALLIEKLWQAGKTVCLPRLHPFVKGHLLFFRYQQDTRLKPNPFSILEPELDLTALIPQSQLDIIFTPLVAFDTQGNRLGMGGGFYDRTLQHWQQKNFQPVGLAHQCQQVEQLPIESWDVPLAGILVG